jgi:WD40 repeat protein
MGFATRPGQLWSTTTGKKIGPPQLQQDGTTSAAFSPDGGLLATGTEAGTVRIWRVPSGEAGTPLMPHQSKLRRVLFSPDGSILATLTSSGAVRLWDATTGTPLTASRQLAGGSVSMAFLGMTSEFLAVGGDGVLHRWDCSPADESLEELSRLSDHLSGKLPAR